MEAGTLARQQPPATLVADGPVAAAGRRRPDSLLGRLARNRPALAGAAYLALVVLTALFAQLLAPYDPVAQDSANRMRGISAANWLGTDEFGRDILTRLLYGSRSILLV